MSANINMTNKIKKNLELLRSMPYDPKYKKQRDEVISLYSSRKIENIRTAENMNMKLKPGKGSAGAARSCMKMLEKYRTKESATGKLSRGKMRTYLVKGTVTVQSKYITTNPKSKQRKLNDKVHEDKPKYSLRGSNFKTRSRTTIQSTSNCSIYCCS